MPLLPHLVESVDAAVKRQEDAAEDGMRTHLGASIIGRKCPREVWFMFRWAGREELPGRMYRLLNRGQREEDTFADLLRHIGATVWLHDPATGNQFRVSEFGGHMGGSLDGIARNVPGIDGDAVCEFKTHNDKSFTDLTKKGVQASKPQHFAQAQVYMHKTGIRWALYCAVNKNDDTLHLETFPYEETRGKHLIYRAESIIFGTGLPARISSDPSWFECRFCAFKAVCFGQAAPARNCRTCRHLVAQRDGTWLCQKYMAVVPTSAQKLTHPCHEVMPEFAAQV